MKHRAIVSIAAAAGALAASAGGLAVFSPFGSASATSPGRGLPPAEVASLVGDMAPGAVVTEQADGSVAISGALAPSVLAEVRRAHDLAESSPTAVRCAGKGLVFRCSAVPDSAIVPALKSGEPLYGRTIYRGITSDVTDKAAPMFSAGELVCRGTMTNGVMSCSRVDRVRPTIPSHETLFMTYAPYNVTFDAQGAPTVHVAGNPSVPLARAGS